MKRMRPTLGARLRTRNAEREDQPAIRLESLDPGLGRTLDGEIHIDRIHILTRPFGAIALNDGDVGEVGQIVTSALRKNRIVLDREDMPLRAHEMRQQRRVIARPRADMGDALALSQAQSVQAARMKRW